MLPGLPQPHRRAARARISTRDCHHPNKQGRQRQEDSGLCTQPGRREPGSREIVPVAVRSDTPKMISRFLPCARRGAGRPRGAKGLKAGP